MIKIENINAKDFIEIIEQRFKLFNENEILTEFKKDISTIKNRKLNFSAELNNTLRMQLVEIALGRVERKLEKLK